MRALVVGHGEATADAFERALRELGGPADIVVAADGGALSALAAGHRPTLVVGDADSLPRDAIAALRDDGVEVRVVAPEKDESDMELALRTTLRAGASSIRIVGALGGPRLEHALANLALLALPELDDHDAAIVDARTHVRRIGTVGGPGAAAIDGTPGELVSLQPVDDCVEGVTTVGLRYPLRDEPLLLGPTRGLSNELVGGRARVTTRRGRLLVIRTEPEAEDRTP